MSLDEELDEQEMRILLVNKAAQIVNGALPYAEPSARMSRSQLVDLTKRMAQIADAIPPELKQ